MEIPLNLPETAANGKAISVYDMAIDETITAISDSIAKTDEIITIFAISKKSIAANATASSASSTTTSASTTETSDSVNEMPHSSCGNPD